MSRCPSCSAYPGSDHHPECAFMKKRGMSEINHLRAENEALRRHHKFVVEQWTLEGQRVKEIAELLQQARYHCESEGDDTLVSLINNALRSEGEK